MTPSIGLGLSGTTKCLLGGGAAVTGVGYWAYHKVTTFFSPDNLGRMLNDSFRSFMDSLDLAGMARESGKKDFSDVIIGWLEGADLDNTVQRFFDKVTPAVDRGGNGLRENTLGQLEKFREEAQQIFANVSRDFTLKNAPWVACATALIFGTPLAALYGYHRLKHNIGKPKLAQEIRNYNLIDRTTSAVKSVFGFTWGSIGTYIKWTIGSMFTAFSACFFSSIGYAGSALLLGWEHPGINQMPFFFKVIEDFFCNLDFSGYARTCTASSDRLVSYDNIIIAANCLGLGMVLYNFYKGVSKHIRKNWGVTPAKPIFSPEIKERIDDVVDSINNLKKHGGYFQNLLLYGPGGTGKTMISKYIARNSGMNYVMMSGGDLAQYIKRGEHVTELNKLFKKAKSSAGSTILFIDEAESLCKDRSKMGKDELFELINAFLNHTGEPSDKVMLIMATNRLEDIDPAVLTRMDHKVEIAPPAFTERREIIEMYLTHFFGAREIEEFFHDEALNRITKMTEGLTGRAVFKMLNALSTKKKCTGDNKLTVEMIDLIVNRFVQQEKAVELALA